MNTYMTTSEVAQLARTSTEPFATGVTPAGVVPEVTSVWDDGSSTTEPRWRLGCARCRLPRSGLADG